MIAPMMKKTKTKQLMTEQVQINSTSRLAGWNSALKFQGVEICAKECVGNTRLMIDGQADDENYRQTMRIAAGNKEHDTRRYKTNNNEIMSQSHF